ncbi:MAG TPA: metallophosphoesterase family protein [Longimicrobiales bacterium]
MAGGHRIAVIGDVHGNAGAFDAAVRTAVASGFDELVLLGDLLTYGVDTAAVVDAAVRLCQRDDVTLLRGNHDAEYLPGQAARETGHRPAWVQESIDFTRGNLPADAFARLPFVDEHVSRGIRFGHANPFGRDDWRYLNTIEDHVAALAELERGGHALGVFGHTHRARLFSSGPDGTGLSFVPQAHLRPGAGVGYIVNAGSVGQPRDRPRTVHVLLIDATTDGYDVRFVPFDYDVAAHIRSLERAPLSPETIRRLVGFHRD